MAYLLSLTWSKKPARTRSASTGRKKGRGPERKNWLLEALDDMPSHMKFSFLMMWNETGAISDDEFERAWEHVSCGA